MSRSEDAATGGQETVYREYIMDIRIVELPGENTRYRFEAPEHRGIEFEAPAAAELYADVYFDVNGFEEAGTGERGIPPVMIQGGRDTLAAYMLTQPHVDRQWLGSYFAHKPEKIDRMVDNVRKRAESIRQGAKERGLAE